MSIFSLLTPAELVQLAGVLNRAEGRAEVHYVSAGGDAACGVMCDAMRDRMDAERALLDALAAL